MDCLVEELPRAESESYNKKHRQICHGKWDRESVEEYARKKSGIIHGKPAGRDRWHSLSFRKKEFILVKDGDVEKQFRKYADAWYEELSNDAHSSLTRMTCSLNYLHVIGLVPKRQVITLILKELQETSAPWFLALQILTGNTEVGTRHSGNFHKIAEDWIEWGFQKGYLYETTFSI